MKKPVPYKTKDVAKAKMEACAKIDAAADREIERIKKAKKGDAK